MDEKRLDKTWEDIDIRNINYGVLLNFVQVCSLYIDVQKIFT